MIPAHVHVAPGGPNAYAFTFCHDRTASASYLPVNSLRLVEIATPAPTTSIEIVRLLVSHDYNHDLRLLVISIEA